jgi:hypothetical protein
MDERAYQRVVVDLEVLATVGARSMQVTVYDLSMDGCAIEARGDPLPAPSSAINLYIPDVNVTRGTLIWTQGHFGGVKFAERMHEELVQHLGFKPKEKTAAFRDQFGRPLLIPGQRFSLQP